MSLPPPSLSLTGFMHKKVARDRSALLCLGAQLNSPEGTLKVVPARLSRNRRATHSPLHVLPKIPLASGFCKYLNPVDCKMSVRLARKQMFLDNGCSAYHLLIESNTKRKKWWRNTWCRTRNGRRLPLNDLPAFAGIRRPVMPTVC